MKFFRKLKDNVIFAMNLNDEIPEHIRQEIMREEKLRLKPKLGSTVEVEVEREQNPEPELETETEDSGIRLIRTVQELIDVNEFNANVENKLGSGLELQSEPEPEPEIETEEAFFAEIIGYSDIKRIILKCIQSSDREPVHVILDGPPASAKSMFLMAMKNRLNGVYYVDCTNATGPGLIQYLFDHDVKFLLLDEVEKMSDDNQNVLLNVMETGILTSTKVRKTGTKEMNLSIYATTNDIDEISKPFRSRFMEFSLPEYTYKDFCEIAEKLLAIRYGHNEELALKIADTVWNKMGSKDVRDLLKVGKLSNTVDDVDFVAITLQKYRRKD